VFFSEYGCNKVQPRVFDEVQALYGPEMTSLSGGLVYEYSQETSDYGLVEINGNGTVTLRVDYINLQSQFAKLNISLLESTNATATQLAPPTCSSGLIDTSAGNFSTNFDIPEPPSGAQDLINNGISSPVRGSLVSVTATSVPVAIYGTDGAQLSNIAITSVANGQGNTPGAVPTSTGGPGASASATPTKKAGAARNGATALLSSVAVFGAIMMLAVL